jgi:hypothetical protein
MRPLTSVGQWFPKKKKIFFNNLLQYWVLRELLECRARVNYRVALSAGFSQLLLLLVFALVQFVDSVCVIALVKWTRPE